MSHVRPVGGHNTRLPTIFDNPYCFGEAGFTSRLKHLFRGSKVFF